MESFFLAETTKYLYLLFDTENFIHNTGNQGTVIETPNGQCVIETGGYIFNTEAHPIDPSALYCCHDVPKMKFYDFNEFHFKKSLYRGESLENSFKSKRNETVEDVKDPNGIVEKLEITTTELNNSFQDNGTSKINLSTNEGENFANSTTNSSVQQIFEDTLQKFDPQQMLERIRKESRYARNESWQENFKLMSCKAQPFLQRLSIMGEFFNA